LTPGQHVELGGVTLAFVCGFSKPPSDWEIADDSERYNAGSIVLRLTYKGKSILFCGDAVGRHLHDQATACINTEKFMVDHAATVPISSDVMIAPHHGSDGASSPDFIQAVHPREVIFSAGHKFQHPRMSAVQRYMDFGITELHLFRTDRGDNEKGKEWVQPPIGTASDPLGDDDVDVLIEKDGKITVAYRN
jgi:competence protein ComEC